MHFALTDDQREIKQTARALLAERCSAARVAEHADGRGHDSQLWDELVGLGWPALGVPEEHGGLGLGVVEAMCLADELGGALASVPYLGTAAAALLIRGAGSADQKRAWLPRLANGEVLGTFGMARDGQGELVPEGTRADLIVLVEKGRAKLLTPATAKVEPVDTIDRTRRYAKVTGEGESLPDDAALPAARVSVLVAAEMVGLCQRTLDMTVAYVKDRRQFERPVGAFQAVAHRCADMLVDVEAARSLVYGAAWAADVAPGTLARSAALAMAYVGDAARRVTSSAVQAHGGIGFTWESGLHWWLRRAQLDAVLVGAPGHHRQRVADAFTGDVS
ncbi:Acyl-CoA dehydrogenase domain protein [Frankia canadensis]|uniref:Acyl-CoA dehydrogenase domain protein n=1 Tax=Frankia canadensis TaxID=1836972 RepID=A0A2I2KI03_9ACTN|nr:acyl-CoA dehydrogenase family protein [Frankia canadensis]SNQ45298.1 Acyl-CoA dehydrogenase domain protein [Frankia canadensis]SOU52588.1 Acyl-CoA dehydrogenase domain protein [Frankia canadensis]